MKQKLGFIFKIKKYLILFLGILALLLLADAIYAIHQFKQVGGSIKVYDSNNTLIYESISGLEGFQTPISLDSMPKHVSQAIISAEDTRFYKHFGIDPLALARALVSNIRAKKIVSGGSTITQQIARKNIYTDITFLNNKYIRKIREINSALFFELLFSKEEILERYINSVYYGYNSYGIEAASWTYFNKPTSNLSVSEAALLAGLIRSPHNLNPKDNPSLCIKRKNDVLDLMHKNSYLTTDELGLQKAFPVGLNLVKRPSQNLHFVEYALDEAKDILDKENTKDLQGMHIYTTLDLGISNIAQNAAKQRVADLSEKHHLSNAAVVVLDTKDSRILAMVGSIDYFNENIQGSINMAIRPRQPGSALKPITYAQAFYEGLLEPDHIIIDEKTIFVDKNGKSFAPYNYNGVFNGPVSVRTALGSSLNLPAVKVLEMVGVEDMISTAQKLGIKSLNNPDRYGLSVTLGGGEVTLLELTNTYNSLARGGAYKDVFSVTKIVDTKGNILHESKSIGAASVWGDTSKEVSNTIYSILSDPNAKILGFGRNNVLNLPFKAASKTGTTTDWHDNWTLGYTKDFTVGVWVGNADNSPMIYIDGVSGAGPIWREVMIKVNELIVQQESNDTYIDRLIPVDASEDLKNAEVVEPKITSPAPQSIYLLSPYEFQFEKIAFEVTTTNTIYSVEYILNGESLGITDKNPSFKYLWSPQEGDYILVAKFMGQNKEVISQDSTSFTVLKAKP